MSLTPAKFASWDQGRFSGLISTTSIAQTWFGYLRLLLAPSDEVQGLTFWGRNPHN